MFEIYFTRVLARAYHTSYNLTQHTIVRDLVNKPGLIANLNILLVGDLLSNVYCTTCIVFDHHLPARSVRLPIIQELEDNRHVQLSSLFLPDL